MGLVRAAEAAMPQKKASGETANILAEFAIIMAKASLNIVTDLEFDDGLSLLRKAAEFYEGGESTPMGWTIQGLIKGFQGWQENWRRIEREVPRCMGLIGESRVCECERLNRETITPASNAFVVYASASPQQWEISTATGQPRPIPAKDRLVSDLRQALERAKRGCVAQPAMRTPAMAQLSDYEVYKLVEKSPSTNREEFRKNAALPISDEQAIQKAEQLLSEPGLCDCERDRILAILRIAQEDFKVSKLQVDLTANRKFLELGETVRVSLLIKSGRKPYSYTLSGDLSARAQMDPSPGLVTDYIPKTAGAKTVEAVVTDSAGDTRRVSVSFEVRSRSEPAPTKGSGPAASAPAFPPVYNPTLDPSVGDKGKSLDLSSVDSLSSQFQETKQTAKKSDARTAGPPSMAQSDTYTGRKQNEGKPDTASQPLTYAPSGTGTSDATSGARASTLLGGTYGPSTGASTAQTGKATTPSSTTSASAPSSPTMSGSSSSSPTTSAPAVSSPTASASASTSPTTNAPSSSMPITSAPTSGTLPSSSASPAARLSAVYENNSDQYVHIFTEGESFDPKNRLMPGERRTVSVTMPADGRVKFISGRNGQVISAKFWNGDPGNLQRYPMVRFTKGMGGKEELAITTTLK